MSFPNDTNKQLEQLLRQLTNNGTISFDSEDEIEEVLGATVPLQLSSEFTRRALAAIKAGQARRAAQLPTFELGQKILETRQRRDLLVEDVAKTSSIPTDTLERLEQGVLSIVQLMRQIPPVSMRQILNTIGLDIDEFADELMNIATNSANRMGRVLFSTRIQQRAQNDVDRLTEEVAAYIEQIEALD